MNTLVVPLVAGMVACTTLTVLADDYQPSGDTSSPPPVEERQGKTYDVDCYKDKPNEGLNLGSLTVTSPAEAGPACNATFHDCHEKCYGCFLGADGQTCVDNSGSTLKR